MGFGPSSYGEPLPALPQFAPEAEHRNSHAGFVIGGCRTVHSQLKVIGGRGPEGRSLSPATGLIEF
jgi:hypothetical protein